MLSRVPEMEALLFILLGLLGFNLPYYDAWEVSDLRTLSKSQRKLLESV